MLFVYVLSSAQTQTQTQTPQASKPAVARLGDQNKMTPWMTEIWDPEVKIIQPGAKDSDAPSDAIVFLMELISARNGRYTGKSFKVDS